MQSQDMTLVDLYANVKEMELSKVVFLFKTSFLSCNNIVGLWYNCLVEKVLMLTIRMNIFRTTLRMSLLIMLP